MNARASQVVKVACPHDCPDTCGMLVTVQDGVATKIQGDPTMPFTEGTLCTKVAHYLERTYSPDRLMYPQKRVGKKGEGKFKRISWDEALDEIAARLKAIEPESILPCSYAGTMGMVQYSSMDRRFFHKLGASLLDRTLCSSAGKYGMKATLGGSVGMDPERFVESKLIILWGANPIVSNLHLWSRVQEAKRKGARVIAIDPYRSLSAEKCTQHVALLPGTDGALALAMMHVLIAENLIDRDYIEKYTLGFEKLSQRVKQYTPQWAAAVCGLKSEEIVQLARDYGRTRPAAIRLNYGMQRHAGGERKASGKRSASFSSFTSAGGLKNGSGSMPCFSSHSLYSSHLPDGVGKPPCANGANCCGTARRCQPSCFSFSQSCLPARAVRQMSSSESLKHASSNPIRAARRRNTSEFGSDSPTGAIAGLLAST
jgi:anaerobic selenocysteine-containing dehydrogenase